jgi:hypothetical protein
VLRAAAASLLLFLVGPDAPTELFRFQDPEIRESSGVAVGARRDDVFFTHNDSGDAARFFAVDATGCTVSRYALEGADAIDWEDMSAGPEHKGKPTLWLGDIGDNAAARSSIMVYRVTEPKVPRANAMQGGCGVPLDLRVAATEFDLRYADGPHDAEALIVHPKTGRLFVATKGGTAGLYAAPKELRVHDVNVLERVAAIDARVGLVTAGDLSPDGKHLVLRNYGEALEWRVRKADVAGALDAAPTVLTLPPTRQGEAIAYADADTLITTTEDPAGTGAPVHRVPR